MNCVIRSSLSREKVHSNESIISRQRPAATKIEVNAELTEVARNGALEHCHYV